jgi:spoIIIJ-associated protein
MAHEFSGKTVEEAIQKGLRELGWNRDEVDVEIITRGSRGVLGIGATDARVLIRRISPPVREEEREEGAAEPAGGEQAFDVTPAQAEKPPTEPVEGKAPREDEMIQVAVEILSEMVRRMGFDADVVPVEEEDLASEGRKHTVLNITARGDDTDLSYLIGRKGEVLNSIQYLLRMMVSHRLKRWVDLAVDVNGYRSHRERSLVKLAHRVAEQVAQSGRGMALEAMPPRERRIIHLALRDHPDVITRSIGEGERRRVTVVPKQ